MVHVACHDLRSFHNFNLLTYFSFAYKSLYRCALWCFTSMYATLSLLHLKFDKLLMMRVRIASINSLCITIIKWTDDRFAAAQLLLQLQRPTDFQLMNEEIESLLLQLDNHSLVVTVIEVSHGATLVTVCLNKLHYNFCNHRDNRVILWYTKLVMLFVRTTSVGRANAGPIERGLSDPTPPHVGIRERYSRMRCCHR